MIIECDACKSRFRLDRKLIHGYRAVRVRCRKCGNPIFVMVPQPPVFRETASAPSFVERRRRPRGIHGAAMAQPLLQEEAVAEATPGNIVDLQRFREVYRKRMLAGAYDISGHISTEIPPATAPVPPVLESICQVEEPSPVHSGIMEEPFLLKERSRPRASAGLSVFTVTLLFTAVGTAIGYLVLRLLLPVLAWTLK